MIYRWATIALTSSIVIACGRSSAQATVDTVMVFTATPPVTPNPANDTVRASYVWGAEVNELKPCGGDSIFWVLASPAIIRRLRTAQESLQTSPYDRIFITVRGARSDRPTDGFAEQTNVYFEVRELLEVRRLVKGEC